MTAGRGSGRGRRSLIETPWVLYFSGIPWRFQRQRQHELALQLARDFRVLFIEPPSLQGSRSIDPQPVARRVWVLCPWGPFPLGRVLPPLNTIARRLLARGLARWLQIQDGPAVAWIDEDLAAACAGRCGEASVVYDAVDEDWTFTRPWNRWHMRREMRRACRRADLIISSSHSLARRLPRGASSPIVVANACDPGHFRPDGPVAPEVAALPRPVLGFAGTVSERALDVGLLEDLARRRPGWSLVFAGPCESRVRARLSRFGNATFLGPVDYERLPPVLRSFDVCLIPYRTGAVVDYVLPKKLFEYLASGKPVVATPLPELRAFRSHVQLAPDGDGFVEAVEATLAGDGPAEERRARDRRALALHHTWERRGRIVRRLVSGLSEAAA